MPLSATGFKSRSPSSHESVMLYTGLNEVALYPHRKIIQDTQGQGKGVMQEDTLI